MKTSLIKIPILTLLYIIIWIAGLMIGFAVFPPEATSEIQDTGFDPMMLAVSFLHVAVLYSYAMHAHTNWVRIAIISFGLTYLITQVESLWFINAVNISASMLSALLLGGLISSALFSWVLIKVMKPSAAGASVHSHPIKFQRRHALVLILLIVVIWPMIYFLAGYYIAWQSADIREYYTGSVEMKSFAEMMIINLQDGLYTFQVIRSFIWIALAYLILTPLNGKSLTVQCILTGALFAILGSSQLLLENPLMPEMVRYMHLVETAISTFIWGGILAWFYHWYSTSADSRYQIADSR